MKFTYILFFITLFLFVFPSFINGEVVATPPAQTPASERAMIGTYEVTEVCDNSNINNVNTNLYCKIVMQNDKGLNIAIGVYDKANKIVANIYGYFRLSNTNNSCYFNTINYNWGSAQNGVNIKTWVLRLNNQGSVHIALENETGGSVFNGNANLIALPNLRVCPLNANVNILTDGCYILNNNVPIGRFSIDNTYNDSLSRLARIYSVVSNYLLCELLSTNICGYNNSNNTWVSVDRVNSGTTIKIEMDGDNIVVKRYLSSTLTTPPAVPAGAPVASPPAPAAPTPAQSPAPAPSAPVAVAPVPAVPVAPPTPAPAPEPLADEPELVPLVPLVSNCRYNAVTYNLGGVNYALIRGDGSNNYSLGRIITGRDNSRYCQIQTIRPNNPSTFYPASTNPPTLNTCVKLENSITEQSQLNGSLGANATRGTNISVGPHKLNAQNQTLNVGNETQAYPQTNLLIPFGQLLAIYKLKNENGNLQVLRTTNGATNPMENLTSPGIYQCNIQNQILFIHYVRKDSSNNQITYNIYWRYVNVYIPISGNASEYQIQTSPAPTRVNNPTHACAVDTSDDCLTTTPAQTLSAPAAPVAALPQAPSIGGSGEPDDSTPTQGANTPAGTVSPSATAPAPASPSNGSAQAPVQPAQTQQASLVSPFDFCPGYSNQPSIYKWIVCWMRQEVIDAQNEVANERR